MRIWLDDERNPKDPYIQSEFGSEGDEIWAKTAQVAISYLKQGNCEHISLDHDLGMAATGLDVAEWIEEQAYLGNLPKLQWSVHSLNPVGKKNITQAMTKADEYWERKP